jgi:hypothetical protein
MGIKYTGILCIIVTTFLYILNSSESSEGGEFKYIFGTL